jgi:hypothetical protein
MSVQRLDTLRKSLREQRRLGRRWRDIAADYPGVPAGTLCAIFKGRNPKKHSVRAALGLPVQRRRTFEQNWDAWKAWKAANAERLADIVAWAEEK